MQHTDVLAPAAPDETVAKRSSLRLGELFAVGAFTPLLFPISWLLRRWLGLDDAQLAVGFTFFWGAWIINDPHFAVTYLLFYEDAKARAFGDAFPPTLRWRWRFAGIVAPLVLAAWGIGAIVTRAPLALGLMIQLMFFTVGWHYVKQGFGVMTVLMGRRGVRFTPRERRAILAHCFAGWAYAWASPFDPGREVEEKGVIYTTVRHPPGLERATLALAVVTLVVVAAVLARKAWRERAAGTGPRMLGPLAALLSSIWLWSVWSNADPLVVYAIPALHSIQYLYFVGLLRSNQAREREGPPWFERSAKTRLGLLALGALGLGVLFFHAGPTALDDLFTPKKSAFTDMGPTPFFAAVYAFVNVHHYLMDNVIWRRENPAMRYLTVDAAAAPPERPRPDAA